MGCLEPQAFLNVEEKNVSCTLSFPISVYWDYALIVPLSQIVCIHCHQQRKHKPSSHGGATKSPFCQVNVNAAAILYGAC